MSDNEGPEVTFVSTISEEQAGSEKSLSKGSVVELNAAHTIFRLLYEEWTEGNKAGSRDKVLRVPCSQGEKRRILD